MTIEFSPIGTSGKVKRVIIRSLIVFLALGSSASAQTIQENGLYGGTLLLEKGVAPVSYFVDSPERFEFLQNVLYERRISDALLKFSIFYDNYLIIVHPESVSRGMVSPEYSSFASEEFVDGLNRLLNDKGFLKEGCLVLPFVAADPGKEKSNVLAIYSFSADGSGILKDGDVRSCIEALATAVEKHFNEGI